VPIDEAFFRKHISGRHNPEIAGTLHSRQTSLASRTACRCLEAQQAAAAAAAVPSRRHSIQQRQQRLQTVHVPLSVCAPHKPHALWRSSKVVKVGLLTEPCVGS
jgi:hypothetical protein